MAYKMTEDEYNKMKGSKKLAGSFMGVSGEIGPMSKKDYKQFKQFILDNTVDGSTIQKNRLEILKKQRKFGV